jgi:multiple sugar transport system substrate-binding protein
VEEKMFKKRFQFFVAILLLVGLLAGCAAPATIVPTGPANASPAPATQVPTSAAAPSSSAPTTLSILYMQHWAPGADQVIKNEAIAWGKENNVTINFNTIAEADFALKIANEIDNKSGAPDIVLMRTTSPILYQDSMVDVSDIAKEVVTRDGEFYPANKAEAYTGTAYVTVPLYSVISVWFYQMNVLKAAGVEFPTTYADFLDFAKKVNDPQNNDYAFGLSFNKSRDATLYTQAVLWAFGSKVTEADGKTIAFNSPETLAALKYIASMYTDKLMPAGVTGWNDASNNQAFLAGQLVTTTNGPSIYYQLKSTKSPLLDTVNLAKWPAGPAGSPVMMDTYGLGILKSSKNQALAKSLLRYIYQPANLEAFYNAGMGFQNPTITKYSTMDVFTSDPKLKVVTDMLAAAHAPGWPGPVNKAVAEIEAQFVLSDMVERVLVDGITPEASVAETTKRIEDIYAKYK